MATVFTRIIRGEIPGTFVWRDEFCVAFLSINPLARGHTLVVPIEEVDHWIDVPAELASHVFAVARHVGRAQQNAFAPARVGLMIAGYEVPHTHLHVVPTNDMSELSFENAQPHVDRDELAAFATPLRNELRCAGYVDQVEAAERSS